MLSFIHSTIIKSYWHLTRKPRGRRILARRPTSVRDARGPKLNTKESSGMGLSVKERPARKPRPDSVVNSC